MIFIARFLFILTLTFPLAALAAEPLIFKKETADLRAKSALSYLEKEQGFSSSQPYQIATIDLNDDGIAEWIIRQDKPGCEKTATCPFFVVGLSNHSPRLLGDVFAGKIGITDKKAYGVSTLVVYNDPNNDFASKSYSWDPSIGRFKLY